MYLMSDLFDKISAPSLSIGSISQSIDNDWHVSVTKDTTTSCNNAFKLNFQIPYDPSLKVLRGNKGEQGPAATIRLGTVTTGMSAAVTNTGNEHDAIFNFVLPKGDKGNKGDKGDKGSKGSKGDKGDRGEQGAAAVVKVGDVDFSTTGLVRVTNRSISGIDGTVETLLDFHFPKVIVNSLSSLSFYGASSILFPDNTTLIEKYNDIKADITKLTTTMADQTISMSSVIINNNMTLQQYLEQQESSYDAEQQVFSLSVAEPVFEGNTVTVANIGSESNPNLLFTFPADLENFSLSSTIQQPASMTTAMFSSWPVFLDAHGNLNLEQTNIVPVSPNEGTIGTYSLPFANGAFTHLVMGERPLLQREIFTINGTFQIPEGVNTLFITAVAGGGGGAIGTGGGGGEGCVKRVLDVKGLRSIDVIVGYGGAGNRIVYDGLSNTFCGTAFKGQDGGNTIVGSVMLQGGKGGKVQFDITPVWTVGSSGGNYACHGANATLFDIKQDNVITISEKENKTDILYIWNGGSGGSSLLGSGGTGGMISYRNIITKIEGSNGCGFGSGGGGGAIVKQGNYFLINTAGGTGAPGIAIIEWE